MLAECSACAGVMPYFTIRGNSFAGLIFQSKPPASVPKAIFTPAFSARRNVSSWILIMSTQTFAPVGGAAFRHVLADKQRGHIVGSVRHHGLQVGIGDVMPCSMVSTPASTELCTPFSALACEATLRRSRWASSTMALQFVESEGRNIIEHAIGPHVVAAVGVHLDPVHAMGDLLAHRFASVLGAIDFLHALGHFSSHE